MELDEEKGWKTDLSHDPPCDTGSPAIATMVNPVPTVPLSPKLTPKRTAAGRTVKKTLSGLWTMFQSRTRDLRRKELKKDGGEQKSVQRLLSDVKMSAD